MKKITNYLEFIKRTWTTPKSLRLTFRQKIKRWFRILTRKYNTEDVLFEILSDEIQAEINREIIQSIFPEKRIMPTIIMNEFPHMIGPTEESIEEMRRKKHDSV